METEKGDVSPKMYEIDDLIMYGSTGVCKVSDITKPDFAGSDEDRLYYVLEPLYQSGVIYAPVDNEKVHMRPVISEDEAKNVLEIYFDLDKNAPERQEVQGAGALCHALDAAEHIGAAGRSRTGDE